MKKTNYLLALTFLVITSTFYSCEDEQNDTSPEEMEEINFICVGNESLDPLPLAIGNRWYFKKKTGGTNLEIKINKTVLMNNTEYFKLEYTEELGSFDNKYEKYYRKAPNGDVFEFVELFDGTSREYLVVPMNPTNGQEWEYFGFLNDLDYKRKVRLVNTNFPIETENCTYPEYIIIDEVSVGTSPTGNDNIITNEIYVRGIGFMENATRELSELTLN